MTCLAFQGSGAVAGARCVCGGQEFAEKLGVKPGDSATLISSTMFGSMAFYNFKIAGTVKFGMTALDRGTIITDIRGARAALDMQDSAGEILGYRDSLLYDEEAMKQAAADFNKKHSNGSDEFSPVMTTLSAQEGLGDIMNIAKTFGFVLILVFVSAMSVVLWNSGLLNGIRRYGEIGVRLAMGEPKGALYRRMIYESILTGLAGSAAGTLPGIAISYYLQYYGLDIGSMMQNSTALFTDVIRAKVTLLSWFIGFIPGLLASVLGTMAAGIGIYKRQTAQLFKELEV